jgi:hypothetical protein
MAALLTAGACGSETTAETCPASIDGLEVVIAGGQGLWRESGVQPRLVEVWRRAGLNEDEHLAHPASFAADGHGRLAIPDFRLSEAIVIEPDGDWLGAWGTRGRGPGEISTPVAVAWNTDGTLVVFDIVAPKVLFLNDGEASAPDVAVAPSFTAPIVASGQLSWAGVQPSGGVLLQPSHAPMPDGGSVGLSRASILRLAPGSQLADTLAMAVVHTLSDDDYSGWAAPGAPRLVAAVGLDGSIAIGGHRTGYLISLFDSAGTPARHVCRDAPPLPLTNRETRATAESPPELASALKRAPAPDTLAAFGRLVLSTDGTVWIQRDRPAIANDADGFFGVPGAAYDLIDPHGQYVGEVRAPPRARLQAVSGELVYAMEVGGLDDVQIVAYRLVLD